MRHLLAMTPRSLPSFTVRDFNPACMFALAYDNKPDPSVPKFLEYELHYEPGTVRPAIRQKNPFGVVIDANKQQVIETEAPISWFDFTASYDIDVRRIVTSKDILLTISLVDVILHLSKEVHDSVMRPTTRSAYLGYKEVDREDSEYVLRLPGMPGEYGGDSVFDPNLPEVSTLEWPDLRRGDKLSIGVRLRRGCVSQVVTGFHLVAEW